MLVKRRTMRKLWALLSIFILTFVVATAGAGAMMGLRGLGPLQLSWFRFW